jgi:hypothetical protein
LRLHRAGHEGWLRCKALDASSRRHHASASIEIIELFERRGARMYHSKAVSQSEHALQRAALADLPVERR